MSRIAVCTFGSEGDIRPFVALTQRLRAAGEDAVLLAPEFFRRRAEDHGVPFIPSGSGADPAKGHTHAAAAMRSRNPLKQTDHLFEFLGAEVAEGAKTTLEYARSVDLIVHHHVDLAAFAAAVALRKPRISVQLFHATLPASNLSPMGMDFGRWGNAAVSRFSRWAFARISQRHFAATFREAGVPMPPRAFFASGEDAALSLLAVSPAFVPRDPAWPANIVQTGYWFLKTPDFTPSPQLAAFIDGGPPPVVATFGSMSGADGRGQVAALIEGTRRAGARLLIQAGWGGLGEGVELPSHVLRTTDYLPHEWLFERAALVIHHGGAGTTAAALRAGVPQTIAYHIGDQLLWANLVHDAGISPVSPLWQRRLKAGWVERAVRGLTPEVRAAATTLGETVRAEDGLGRAVEEIRAMRKSPSPAAG